MTLYEERKEASGEQGGDGVPPSPALPPRLRPRGGRKPGPRATRRRVRWARVFGAFVALVCALVMLAAAVSARFFSAGGYGFESPFPVTQLWQSVSGLGLLSLWQVEDGTVPGAEMAAAWRSRLERFRFGEEREGVAADEAADETADETADGCKGAEPLGS